MEYGIDYLPYGYGGKDYILSRRYYYSDRHNTNKVRRILPLEVYLARQRFLVFSSAASNTVYHDAGRGIRKVTSPTIRKAVIAEAWMKYTEEGQEYAKNLEEEERKAANG